MNEIYYAVKDRSNKIIGLFKLREKAVSYCHVIGCSPDTIEAFKVTLSKPDDASSTGVRG